MNWKLGKESYIQHQVLVHLAVPLRVFNPQQPLLSCIIACTDFSATKIQESISGALRRKEVEVQGKACNAKTQVSLTLKRFSRIISKN